MWYSRETPFNVHHKQTEQFQAKTLIFGKLIQLLVSSCSKSLEIYHRIKKMCIHVFFYKN